MQRSRTALIFSLPALLFGGCGDGGAHPETFPLCAAEEPGPAPLRRITRFEYGRTISDLTGVAPSVADHLPPDEETLGFDDIADAYCWLASDQASFVTGHCLSVDGGVVVGT